MITFITISARCRCQKVGASSCVAVNITVLALTVKKPTTTRTTAIAMTRTSDVGHVKGGPLFPWPLRSKTLKTPYDPHDHCTEREEWRDSS
jgi:hypothetical protein